MEPIKIEGASIIGMRLHTLALGTGIIEAWEPAKAWSREHDAYWVQFGDPNRPWAERAKDRRLIEAPGILRSIEVGLVTM